MKYLEAVLTSLKCNRVISVLKLMYNYIGLTCLLVAQKIRRISPVGMYFVAFAVLIIHALRVIAAVKYPQFWAEDGKIFYEQDYSLGLNAFFKSYAGYLHLWPRLAAFVIGFLPLLWGPAMYKLAALFTHGLLLMLILNKRFPGDTSQKFWMLLFTVFIPNGGEVFMNLTNTNSICAIIMIVIFVMKPAMKVISRIYEGLIILITSMTGPFAIFLFPVFIAFVFFREGKLNRKFERAGFLLAGFIIQIYFLDIQDRTAQSLSLSFVSWSGAFFNFFPPFIKMSFQIPLLLKLILLILSFIIFLLIIYLIFAGKRDWRSFLGSTEVFFAVCALAIHASVLFLGRAAPDTLHPFGSGQRYFYIPYVLILFILILREFSSSRLSNIRNGIVFIFFASSLFHFQSRWQSVDLNWPQQVRQFEQQRNMDFKILPVGWTMSLDKKQSWRNSFNIFK